MKELFLVIGVDTFIEHGKELSARKCAEDLVKKDPAESLGIFRRIGTVRAEVEPTLIWEGVDAMPKPMEERKEK